MLYLFTGAHTAVLESMIASYLLQDVNTFAVLIVPASKQGETYKTGECAALRHKAVAPLSEDGMANYRAPEKQDDLHTPRHRG